MGSIYLEYLEKISKRKTCCPSRRDFLKTCATLAAGAAVGGGAAALAPRKALAALILPSWRGTAAVSDVFVVKDIPVPTCSLASGALPDTGACSTPDAAFRDAGVEALVKLMQSQGTPFYRTAARPTGIVPVDAVVILKVNNQWGGGGGGTGQGRMATNTDLLKGLIWKILNHPDGFKGEVVVADNAQPTSQNRFEATPANAEDREQSFVRVVQAFVAEGHAVSLSDWTALNANLIDGGMIGEGYPQGEYALGDMADAYITLGESDEPEARRLSYPKFRTAGGRLASLRHGLWDGSAYHADRVCLINFPVLKKHAMAGCTAAWKNLIGLISCMDADNSRLGGWDAMHGAFWGYNGAGPVEYGLLGRQLALVRAPDLHILDAIWVCQDNNYSSWMAERANALMASRDPFALDWYASEYLLRPLVPDSPQDSSAARGGVFRSATRVNQKAAKAAYGLGYPYMDYESGYNGDTPSDTEKNRMNVHVAAAPTGNPGLNLLLMNQG